MSRPTAAVARHTFAYATGSIAGGISRAVLLFVIARTLDPAEYGVLSLLLATTNLVHLCFELGLVTSLIRFHHATEDEDERRQLRATLFSLMPLIDLLLAVPLLLFRDAVSVVLFGTAEYGLLVALAIGIAFFAAQFQLYLGHLRARDRSREFALLMAAKGVISLSVTLYLVYARGFGVAGFLLGNLAGPAVVAVVGIPRLLARTGRPQGRTRERWRRLLAFGLPLVPSALGLWALSYLDGWLLRVRADLDAVGVYSFGSEVCLPIAVLLMAIHLAWPSFAFARARKEGGPADVAKVFRHLFLVLTFGGLAIAVLRREALFLLGADAFERSVDVIPWLAGATVLYAASQAFGTGLQVAGDTRRLPWLVFAAALLNAGLNYVLIPTYRELGAAVTTVATNVVLSALVLIESHRQFVVPFEVGRLVRALAAALLVLAVADRVPDWGLAGQAAARLALLATFPLILVPFGVITAKELRNLPSVGREIAGGRA